MCGQSENIGRNKIQATYTILYRKNTSVSIFLDSKFHANHLIIENFQRKCFNFFLSANFILF